MAGNREPSKYTKNIGLRIKKIRELKFGKSLIFAKAMGVTPSTVSIWEAGKVAFTADMIYEIAEMLSVPPGWLFAGGEEPPVAIKAGITFDRHPPTNAVRPRDFDAEEGKTVRFHVVGEAAAFEGGGALAGSFDESDYSIWGDVEIPETTHFVRVRGDSMSPVLLDGQYAMVGPEYIGRQFPGEGDIVIAQVDVKDEEQAGTDAPWEGVYCKRIKDGESTWVFESVNPAFQPFSIAKADCRLWPVIGVYFAGKGKPPVEE